MLIDIPQGDLRRFDGLELKEPKPAGNEKLVPCPLCCGHGEYNRAIKKEFNKWPEYQTQYCNQCNGWGYVTEGGPYATCVHDMQHSRNLGNCLNEYKCSKCGHAHTVDSSG